MNVPVLTFTQNLCNTIKLDHNYYIAISEWCPVELELEPIDGVRVISKEEKEWHAMRMRPISPQVLRQFENDAEDSIKKFLIKLIILTQQFHADMEEHEDCSEEQQEFYKKESRKLNRDRLALFQNVPPLLKEFIKVLNLFPMESWQEFEGLIKNLQVKNMHTYRDLSHATGISAALDNSYLMQVEEDVEEEHMELVMKSRKITHSEIEALIMHYSPGEIVEQLIGVRKVSSGNFWENDFYDL